MLGRRVLLTVLCIVQCVHTSQERVRLRLWPDPLKPGTSQCVHSMLIELSLDKIFFLHFLTGIERRQLVAFHTDEPWVKLIERCVALTTAKIDV